MTGVKKGFHLVSFETQTGMIPLFTDTDFEGGPKASVIIGPNGTGKSRVLAAIADELTNINSLKSQPLASEAKGISSGRIRLVGSGRRFDAIGDLFEGVESGEPTFDARIRYWLDGFTWEVTREGQRLSILRDGFWCSIEDALFPDKVLALAYLPTDKFRFNDRSDFEFYSYLGLRQSTNMMSTGALETKMMFNLIKAASKGFEDILEVLWLRKLGLSLPVLAEVGIAKRTMAGINSFSELQSFAYSELERRSGRTRADGLRSMQSSIDDLGRFWEFFSALKANALHVYEGHGEFRASFELLPRLSGIAGGPEELIEILQTGRRFRLLENFRVRFNKDGSSFGFADLSSGEQQILSTVANLLANLGSVSAVFIDEPEISLHPEWQQQYVPTLLSTLSVSPSTHVIIATHSHFLVSDMRPSEGSLTVSKRDPYLTYENFDGEVFGRSADNILYRVFGIGSSGNLYVENDLTEALEIVSGRRAGDHATLRRIYDRLEPLATEENLALNKILASIEAFLGGDRDA